MILLSSLFPLLIFFVEFLTFAFVWLFLLLGFFYNMKIFSKKFLGRFSAYFSTALTVSICFHLIKMYNQLKAIKIAAILNGPPMSCNSYVLGLLTLSPSCSSYFVALSDNILWRLNPFIVLCDLISEIFVLFADMIGKVTGRFFTSLLNELPWIYQLPALLVLLISLFSSLLILKNYNFRFFYGILELTTISNLKAIPPPIPPHHLRSSLPIPYRRTTSLKLN